MAKHFPGHKTEEYRRMLGKFGVSGDLALQQVINYSKECSRLVQSKNGEQRNEPISHRYL